MSTDQEQVTVTMPPPQPPLVPPAIHTPKDDHKEALDAEDLKSIERIVAAALGSEEERCRTRATIMNILKRVGALAAAKESDYDPGNLMETAIHYMRWQPDYLFECPIKTLHGYEMCLASHILYVKTLENYYNSFCDVAEKNQRRARKLAASCCPGKSVGEREAMAMDVSVALNRDQKTLDKNLMFKTQLEGFADVLTQMDNSLKKTIDRRRNETLHENGYERRENQ